MARSYNGTNNDDAVSGFLYDENVFTNFGIGYDKVTGGYYNDTFKLLVDERTEQVALFRDDERRHVVASPERSSYGAAARAQVGPCPS